MREETNSYASLLRAEVTAHAEMPGSEDFLPQAFTDLVLDNLEEHGFWPDYQLAYHHKTGAHVNGWGYDPAARKLYLCVTDFVEANDARTLPKSGFDAIAKQLKGFYKKAKNDKLGIPEHNPVLDLADKIASGVDFDSIEAYVLTNRVCKAESREDVYEDVPVLVKVWDLETIRRSRTTGSSPEPIVVNFVETFGAGLPCLIAPQEHPDVQILLAFIPGTQLAHIYDTYGPRLLEQNVRSFLMVRGKINKGIRDTLKSTPERFLAYNNGLTATASSIVVEPDADGQLSLVLAKDLQIVNGGQTTASIAFAKREQDSEIDLDSVFVQMKLAVVNPELLEDIVPSISRFANRQNVVQDSDLSANNEDLREIERLSRAVWTPIYNTGRQTKWYFERARGSYAIDKLLAGKQAAQQTFTRDHPTSQRFGKNDLALYENTWSKLPHVVCRGGQKNFAEFIVRIDESFHSKSEALNPTDSPSDEELKTQNLQIFKDLIAKAILFKQADRLVNHALGGTYKRAVVVYTLAYLLEHATETPSLTLIWGNQDIDESLEMAIVEITGPLKNYLIDSAGGRNITEWAKSEACWKAIRSQTFQFTLQASADPPSTTLHQKPPLASNHPKSAKDLDTLAACINRIYGEQVEVRLSGYKQKKWFYLEDKGAEAQPAPGNLGIFAAATRESGAGTQGLDVVVFDFQARQITPLAQLQVEERTATEELVEKWLEAL